MGHNKLELIALPESLKIIAGTAFKNCQNLDEIDLHEGITTIGEQALMGSKLTSVHLPASVTSIGNAAFAECEKLTSITVDENNVAYKVIGDCLVDTRSGKLIQGLSTSMIPQTGITELGEYCFAKTDIVTAQIPEGIKSIPANAFSHCEQLENLTLPSTLETLGATCFAWCYKLKNVELPASLKEIKTWIFASCPLENVVIPAAVDSIGEKAFASNSKLTTVTFKKRLDENGKVVAPSSINPQAFAETGTNGTVTFNVPWSEDYEYSDNNNQIGWGCQNFVINYNYEEA
jgi:hypothetical protein